MKTAAAHRVVVYYYNMLPMLNLVRAALQPDQLLHSREMIKLAGAAQVLYEDILDPTRYHEQTTDKQTTDKPGKQSEVYFQHVVAQTDFDLRVLQESHRTHKVFPGDGSAVLSPPLQGESTLCCAYLCT